MDNIIYNKLLELEENIKIIKNDIENIKSDIQIVKGSTNNMDEHITFINKVYDKYNISLSYLHKGVLSYFTSNSLFNIFNKKIEYTDNNTEDENNQ